MLKFKENKMLKAVRVVFLLICIFVVFCMPSEEDCKKYESGINISSSTFIGKYNGNQVISFAIFTKKEEIKTTENIELKESSDEQKIVLKSEKCPLFFEKVNSTTLIVIPRFCTIDPPDSTFKNSELFIDAGQITVKDGQIEKVVSGLMVMKDDKGQEVYSHYKVLFKGNRL